MINVIFLQARIKLNDIIDSSYKRFIMKKLQQIFLFAMIFGAFQMGNAQFVKDLVHAKPTIKNTRAKIFYQMLNNEKNPQIIDIRTPQEYQSGHIKDAILINFYDPNFAQNVEKAGLDKNKPIYIYCRSGNRTSHSIKIFQQLGFKHIVNLGYGLNEWKHLQLPLVKG